MNSLSNRLFFLLYRAVLWPLLKGLFLIASIKSAKIKSGLKMRESLDGRPPWLDWGKGRKPIWIHCASGEFEYAKPVIAALKARAPKIPILVTYFSPSVAEAARKFPGVDFACPSPWDRGSVLQEFIAWHEPVALLVARTDTWPEMLRQCHLAGIPSLLFSATLSETSGRTSSGFGRWMAKTSFQYLNSIFCVSAADAAEFAKLGFSSNVTVAGDTRYDQVQARLAQAKPINSRLFAATPTQPTLVAGSTWPEDEVVLAQLAQSLQSELRFVLVPHEPSEEHIAELRKLLQGHGIESVLYSTASTWPESSVLIVDRVGILAELYLKGDFAFVGGSFRKTVHSVMEPLAAGCITFVGPLHVNNREALEFKEISIGSKVSCVQPFASAEEFSLLFAHARIIGTSAKEQIRAEIAKRSGKSEFVVDWVLSAGAAPKIAASANQTS